MSHLLSWVVFLPLLGVPALFALPKNKGKWVALGVTLADFVIGMPVLMGFDRAMTGVSNPMDMQFTERLAWIPSLGVEYNIGVDGLSLTMIFLTLLIGVLAVLASWNIEVYQRGYWSMYLLLQTAMLGVFVSLDLILFFLFWEVMLFPMYFLIGVWGGPRRVYAAIKFFLYTLLGGVGMLLSFIAMWYYAPGERTWDMVELLSRVAAGGRFDGPLIFGVEFSKVIFVALFIGFAIKVPIFPFHTWLPDAHVEAPTAISVILAGVLLKMGTYGFLRINFTLFPESFHWFREVLVALAVINIVYGALCALAQTDLKKMVAYSSISHMGFILLGIAAATPQGINGAMLQMFNHGTITAMLFLLVGVVYDRAHHRNIDGFGGLASVTPVYAAITSFAFMAAVGLPGLSGFISELLILTGSFKVYQVPTILAGLGIILGAGYMLWAYQRVFFGPLNEKYKDMVDLNRVEVFSLVPLLVIVVYLGIFPNNLIVFFETSMNHISELLLR
ncbi:MAG: oxidoreductase [Candidatus Lambdaproteobacteria bacterium RIFOXYD1_FULL_56_27]|uniref:Oxidoreductase n=1 Tax=Candidatus Lambdaproteobacteria bacterium RIFOXYD2_FULL_56_26 TaxID=1817773 RepID=A0A1F6H412_9PROT|nr:MAG: oxidoreductase [Candidatus Lambdaproteobacteria bacterium RIFOXYD2_FULL_56_26]OGH05424.1 MAG: oxidoreductase [Candidatus Lambdaproteobacteria bacterium RIFOXYC1_FULL_56_13]OGH09566.1 MAG: oxidoreductase [Candidatus Lambdaproteobacteria bacterium RIFOXYD1_FULL_56_27]